MSGDVCVCVCVCVFVCSKGGKGSGLQGPVQASMVRLQVCLSEQVVSLYRARPSTKPNCQPPSPPPSQVHDLQDVHAQGAAFRLRQRQRQLQGRHAHVRQPHVTLPDKDLRRGDLQVLLSRARAGVRHHLRQSQPRKLRGVSPECKAQRHAPRARSGCAARGPARGGSAAAAGQARAAGGPRRADTANSCRAPRLAAASAALVVLRSTFESCRW